MEGGSGAQRRNADNTVFVGELDPQVDEEVLWELFLQVGPVAYTHIPRVRPCAFFPLFLAAHIVDAAPLRRTR